MLAHDPGAGKTIMAGPLLKELKLRGAIDCVLIPGGPNMLRTRVADFVAKIGPPA